MNRRGFTLIELLVVIIVIGILAATATAFFKVDFGAQRKCSQNLRTISNAIEAYRDATGQYPPDGTIAAAQTLKSALNNATYIPDASVFKCPSDTVAASTDSYSLFYVKRNDKSKMDTFSVGCPRHENGKYALNAFFQGQVTKHKLSEVTSNGQAISPGQAVSSATVADGSTVGVSGGQVTLLQSFDIGNGKCYTLFKSDADPKTIALDVTPGAKLEVVTPSMIAGVEGTSFVVRVVDAATSSVAVHDGNVSVEEKRGLGRINVLAGNQAQVVAGSCPTISQMDATGVLGAIQSLAARLPTNQDKSVKLSWMYSGSPDTIFIIKRNGSDIGARPYSTSAIFRDFDIKAGKTYNYRVLSRLGRETKHADISATIPSNFVPALTGGRSGEGDTD